MRLRPTPALALAILALGLGASPAARAQDDWDDDDDFLFEGEDDPPADDADRLDQPDDLDVDDSGDESLDEFTDPDADDFDLLDGEEPAAASSGDSPSVYRQTQDQVRDAAPDEEIEVWEQYLATYPNTPFRERITQRIAALEEAMYESRIPAGSDGPTDAMDQEIEFSQGLQLENIDPRQRVQFGAEWGLPSYINLFVDYEHPFARTFSVHAGIRRRYTGYNVEAGARWALVKSTRTQTLLTFIGDFHFNTDPAWPGVRPMLAFGKRFGKLDAQIQGGADFQLWSFDTGMPILAVGGLNLTYDASDTVRIFLESGATMKQLTRAGGSFRYNTATFGMKFFPKKDSLTAQASDDVEVNLGATVPYTFNYWTYHYGSVMVQSNLYL